jgi:Heparinase II/III-like protein
VAGDDGEPVVSWSAEHDGYLSLEPPARHRRTVRLDRAQRILTITDQVASEARHRCRLAFHLGPLVSADLSGAVVSLTWPLAAGTASATILLPASLDWTVHRGESDPVMGWYSSGFGCRQPATTLLGSGTVGSADGDLVTVVDIAAVAALREQPA